MLRNFYMLSEKEVFEAFPGLAETLSYTHPDDPDYVQNELNKRWEEMQKEFKKYKK